MIMLGISACIICFILILSISIVLFIFWIKDKDNYELMLSILSITISILLGIGGYKLFNSDKYIYHKYQSRINSIEKAEKNLQKFYIDYPQYKDLSDQNDESIE